MRMWMVDPQYLCRKHLLGEHNEIHMLAGSIRRGKRLVGFVDNGLIEPLALLDRHDSLMREMVARGYRHASPLPEFAEALACYPATIRNARVDPQVSVLDLRTRCPDCAQRLANFKAA